jgi:hypothetical protein
MSVEVTRVATICLDEHGSVKPHGFAQNIAMPPLQHDKKSNIIDIDVLFSQPWRRRRRQLRRKNAKGWDVTVLQLNL